MKSIRNVLWATLLAAGAALTAAAGSGVAAAADDAAAAPPPPGANGWHHGGGPWHLLGQLGKDIMAAAHPQMQSLHEQMRANTLKLQQTKPTDPNYTSIASQVSQTHGSLAAQAVTQHAEVRAQVFKVLTSAQQEQLATLEAQKAQMPHRQGRGGPPSGE
jgi:Spy/CpxP family protein refolding chaperone